jgi:RNA recognition motif-containing protein
MPNINFSAPVIRLGTSGPSKSATPDTASKERDAGASGRRAGLGSSSNLETQRQNVRDAMMQLQPPTREEIVRTIFVGGITEGVGGDEGIERILRSAGNLRRWIRATDADDKPCKFGFAEYEDPDSLGTAVEVLKDIEVPLKRQVPSDGGEQADTEVEKSTLLVRGAPGICLRYIYVDADRSRSSWTKAR